MSAPRQFLLPDLGEGLTEAEVVRWLVEVGDTVVVDQPVVEVETAKAAVEVPTPYGGVVAELHGPAGAVLDVGTPLISIAEAAQAGTSERPADTGADGGSASESASESGNVLVGYGTASTRRVGRRRVGLPALPGATPRNRNGAAATVSVAAQPAASGQPARGRVPVSSPVVRNLAREQRIDVHTLVGSGPDGLVVRRDVEAAIAARQASNNGASTPQATSGDRRVPLRGMRRAVAEQMTRSRREIPEATVWVDVDATALLRVRAEINAAAPDRPVSLLALLTRFCALGLRQFPELNASVDTERDEIVQHAAINIGFAAQTDRGLLVPVLRSAGSASARELTTQIGALTESARTGSLAPADLTGGTFTVNNYGVFGVDGSAAIINHPEAAILGIGRIIDRPWVVDGALAVRKVTELTLAFDHRVCDGRVAGGFLRFVADCVERPTALLGDL